MMITERSKSVIPFRPADAARVGEGCFYLDMIVWLNGDRVEMGDRVGFNYGCYVNGYGGLTIGDRSHLRALHDDPHGEPRDGPRHADPRPGLDAGAVTVEADCWIGMGVCILPGRDHRRGLHRGRRGHRRQGPRALVARRRQPGPGHPQPPRGARVRVLFLQRQPCIRALKYALALRDARPEIALGFAYQGRTLTEWYGSGDDLFDGWWRLAADDPAAGSRRRSPPSGPP